MWWCWATTITDTNQRQRWVIKRVSQERIEELSDYNDYMYSTHIQGRAYLQYKTRHTNASQSSLRHSRHCGLNTTINNKPHQTFRETNRSYGLGISTHSTALNCNELAKVFQSLSALISGWISLSTKNKIYKTRPWSAAKDRKWPYNV